MEAKKNKDKINWSTHSIDFNYDNYTINGGYSIDTITGKVFLELYYNDSNYSDDDVKKEARRAINIFLNLKNKKVVEDGTTFEKKLKLYNEDDDEFDVVIFTFYVTYNP